MDTLLFVSLIFKNSSLNSCDKNIKLLYDKFLNNTSRPKFINCVESINTKFLLIVKALYFAHPLGIILIFKPNLPTTSIIK